MLVGMYRITLTGLVLRNTTPGAKYGRKIAL